MMLLYKLKAEKIHFDASSLKMDFSANFLMEL